MIKPPLAQHLTQKTVVVKVQNSPAQGNRIWIFHSRNAGHDIDSGGVGESALHKPFS
jgi:hypothetical protein